MSSMRQRPRLGVPVYVDGRVVGHVSQAIFYKRMSLADHLDRETNSIVLGVATLAAATENHAQEVCLLDVEIEVQYKAAIGIIRTKGRSIPSQAHEGKKWGLALKLWERIDMGEPGAPTMPDFGGQTDFFL